MSAFDGPTPVAHAMTVPADSRIHESVPAPAQARAATAWVESAYREHRLYVWRVLRRLGLPEAALEDGVQDTFVVLHRRRSAFEGRSSLRTWLYGIALRVARRFHESAAGREAAILRAPLQVAPRAIHTTPEDTSASREAAEIMDRLLDRMDQEQREVFVLFELEGLRGSEIATITGARLNTVHSRLRLARKRFQTLVDEYGVVREGGGSHD